MDLGRFLAKLRKERGLLQKDLADHLKVSVSTISNYEKGVHLPDLDTLIRLVDYFDVSTDYLLQRTGCSLKISKLNHPLTAEDDYSLGDLIQLISTLDQKSLQLLLHYCQLLEAKEEAHIKKPVP